MTQFTPPQPGTVTMFTTGWCGYCKALKRSLDGAGISYNEIDIETNPAAVEYVMSVNGGNQTVPTVLFPDGSAATNPSLKQVRATLSHE